MIFLRPVWTFIHLCCVEMLLQQTYSAKPHTDPLTWTYCTPTQGPLAHPAHTGALGGVGVNVRKVAEVEEGAGLVLRVAVALGLRGLRRAGGARGGSWALPRCRTQRGVNDASPAISRWTDRYDDRDQNLRALYVTCHFRVTI